MSKYSKSSPRIKTVSLPLFDWRPAILRQPITSGGMFVYRRYAVRPELADTIAAFAGLGGQEVSQ